MFWLQLQVRQGSSVTRIFHEQVTACDTYGLSLDASCGSIALEATFNICLQLHDCPETLE